MKNFEGVREGKKKQEIKSNNQGHEAVVKVQREKIQSGRNEDKRFEGEGGVRMQHQEKGARLISGDIPAGGVRGGSHTAARCGPPKNQERSREGSSRSESCQEL